MHKAHSFANTFYFINYLCAINRRGSFEKHFKEIYPEEKERVEERKRFQNFGLISWY